MEKSHWSSLVYCEGDTLREHMKKIERALILWALIQTHWNRVHTSRILSIGPKSLRNKMKRLKIPARVNSA